MIAATISINFTAGPVVFVGREPGEQLRAELNLDGLDLATVPIMVQIPEVPISSSFFLGLFGPSVIKAGSKEAFYAHYQFSVSTLFKQVLDGYVQRALIAPRKSGANVPLGMD
jgi:hypothetical protein